MNRNVEPQFERCTGKDLRRALRQGELSVLYQPQYDLAAGRIAGAEALVRWIHPELGLILPSEFIALAERTRLINDVGHFALRQACSDLRTWHEAGMVHWRMAVNVSPVQLLSGELYRHVCEALTIGRLQGEDLTLEITEAAAVQAMDISRRTLFSLMGLGVRLSVDDFGTGFSNLARLRCMPVHELKIAGELIRELDTSGVERQMLFAILKMAEAMNLVVVAEGVERDTQLAHLRAMGCDFSQGYLHGYPMGADQFLRRFGGANKRMRISGNVMLEVQHG